MSVWHDFIRCEFNTGVMFAGTKFFVLVSMYLDLLLDLIFAQRNHFTFCLKYVLKTDVKFTWLQCWSVTCGWLGDSVVPRKGKGHGLKIFQRFHFSSALKRMSVIAGYTPPGSTDVDYIVTVKGAPEILKDMVCVRLLSYYWVLL